MKFNKRYIYSRVMVPVMTVVAMVCGLTSCRMVNDDLDECPSGVRLRFVYDYNMEFANAFHKQVDCLTVLFYDGDGNWKAVRTEDSDMLADEGYRMTVDLAPGEYRVVAYGGMLCDKASFRYVADPESSLLTGLQVAMNPEHVTSPVGHELHPLFYGMAEVTVNRESTGYEETTVYMMKDTNNLRVILQQIDGEPLDNADFDFVVTDDNTLFGHDNDLLGAQGITYHPWTRGNASPGELPGGVSSQIAYAELSMSRLMTKREPRLVITRRSDGVRIVDIPLVNYLLLLKSEAFASMPPQEFLDRESRWSMIFFLDRGHAWLKTQIVVNNWVVRVNDVKN